MLLEEFSFFEGKKKQVNDSLMLEFVFMTADEVNLNKRVYPFKVVKKAIEKASTRLAKGATLFGAAAHPEKTLELDSVSHFLTKLWLQSKTAFAEAKIVPTTSGKNLSAILKAGGKLGVSARGVGNVKTDKSGISTVQEDYELLSVDFVVSPSFNTFASIREETLFESIGFGYGRLSEADLKVRYYRALEAGYKGSFLCYLKLWKS